MRPAAAIAAGLLAVVCAIPAEAAKNHDYGDAPDGRTAYGGEDPATAVLIAAVEGRFPSRRRSGGPRFADQRLKLGRGADRERDSAQVNIDVGDDGVQISHVPCQEVTYRFVVDARALPRRLRRGKAFLNLFADWNQDGAWEGEDERCGPGEAPEHRIRNEPLNLSSFRKDPVQTISFRRRAGGTTLREEADLPFAGMPFWYRGAISTKRLRADGSGGTGRLGEVEDYGPGVEVALRKSGPDFGDAVFNDITGAGQSAEFAGICRRNSREPLFCEYPTHDLHGGPVHLETFRSPVLGTFVSNEKVAHLNDDDEHDDGFEVLRLESCKVVTIKWTISIRLLREGALVARDRAARQILARLERGKEKIFLDAWVDFGNDGNWRRAPGCGRSRSTPDHVVNGRKLTNKEMKRLLKKEEVTVGVELVRGRVGEVPPEGRGCIRGTVAMGQRYADVAARGGGDPGGAVQTPYAYGETEDSCPRSSAFDDSIGGGGGGSDEDEIGGGGQPDGGSDTVVAACDDGEDNDGDGSIDAQDPGCLESADQSEEHLDGNLPCPSSSEGEKLVSKTLKNGGSTVTFHQVSYGGERFVRGDPRTADAAGPFLVECGGGEVTITAQWRVIGTTIEYDFFIRHLSGPGGGEVSMLAAADTDGAATAKPSSNRRIS